MQKPQCTHLRRMASACLPAGVSRMNSASWVCTDPAARSGYTLTMQSMFWLAVLVSAAAAVWVVLRIRAAIERRKRAEEARAADFLAGFAAQKKKLLKER